MGAKKLWKEENLPASTEPQEQTLKNKLGDRWRFLRYGGFRNRDWYRWTFCAKPSFPKIEDEVRIHLGEEQFKSPDINREYPPFEAITDK